MSNDAEANTDRSPNVDRLREGATISLDTVAEGLVRSRFEVAPRVADRRLILGQTGRIAAHDGDGLQDEPLLNSSDEPVDLGVPHPSGYAKLGLLEPSFPYDFRPIRVFSAWCELPIHAVGTIDGKLPVTRLPIGTNCHRKPISRIHQQ